MAEPRNARSKFCMKIPPVIRSVCLFYLFPFDFLYFTFSTTLFYSLFFKIMFFINVMFLVYICHDFVFISRANQKSIKIFLKKNLHKQTQSRIGKCRCEFENIYVVCCVLCADLCCVSFHFALLDINFPTTLIFEREIFVIFIRYKTNNIDICICHEYRRIGRNNSK